MSTLHSASLVQNVRINHSRIGTFCTKRAESGVNNFYNDPIGHWVVVVLAMVLLLFVLLTGTAYTVWIERVALGSHPAPARPQPCRPVGPDAVAADGIKLAFKESFIPAKTDKVIYVIAPTIAVAAAFLAWSVIPIGLWATTSHVLDRRRQRRRPADLRGQLAERLRDRARRLRLEQQVLAARRPALGGAAHQLRDGAGPVARADVHDRRLAAAARHRRLHGALGPVHRPDPAHPPHARSDS